MQVSLCFGYKMSSLYNEVFSRFWRKVPVCGSFFMEPARLDSIVCRQKESNPASFLSAYSLPSSHIVYNAMPATGPLPLQRDQGLRTSSNWVFTVYGQFGIITVSTSQELFKVVFLTMLVVCVIKVNKFNVSYYKYTYCVLVLDGIKFALVIEP